MSLDPKRLEKTFVAHIDSLAAILTWLRSYFVETGFNQQEWNKIEVAIEEALVNIISYAYHPEKSGWIFLSFEIFPKDRVEFTIKDMGKPFNPEKMDIKRSANKPLDQIPIGGLGIMLMHSYMDEVRYQRDEPYNVLSLIKFCETNTQL